MRVSRRGEVDPFIVMDVMDAAHAAEDSGAHVIHMEVGQPGTPAPSGARAAVRNVLDDKALGYTVALGLPELRARIARLYMDWYGVDLDPERVIVTSGSSAAFQMTFLSLFDAGEKVAIGDPGYPSYRNILKGLSLDPVRIETRFENRYQPTPDDLNGDLDGLLIASPSNPTGTVLDHAHLSALIKRCHDKNIALISDEIYHGIDYGTRATSALEISDDVYVINSFSKYFSMTGWRIGWMVVPQAHIRRVERLMQNFFICAPHVSQVAALHAMDCEDEMQDNLAVYKKNREALLSALPEIGFTRIAPPDGAFYIYADVSDLCQNSQDLSAELLSNARVATTPGWDFDPVRGGHFLRFSYAGTHQDILEGIARLKHWYQTR